ncbi:hypothetical protein O7598_31225 [Micromonospora sp. WMMC241]|uniref:hypothetical protein n=1 Tax=Micromonospora sp. WMMC241 TaxID=3015159 RepID=UPI0022B64DBD|nr:hypothetical protein [Micromonospora sp. WMMC241]MCZ7434792.1 hypothetical protein [Micromonospora sp. WMMC241]MCZ7440847.1 hypothetical protein [Micromonospora sp. WMMC241]MCZ7440898.1 hypothetical protein [Micromonospora sp. WMMC241]
MTDTNTTGGQHRWRKGDPINEHGRRTISTSNCVSAGYRPPPRDDDNRAVRAVAPVVSHERIRDAIRDQLDKLRADITDPTAPMRVVREVFAAAGADDTQEATS